jgi:hypothetical protein
MFIEHIGQLIYRSLSPGQVTRSMNRRLRQPGFETRVIGQDPVDIGFVG